MIRSAHRVLEKTGGRLLIRTSGTEPLIRVMAECENIKCMEKEVQHVLDALAAADQV